MEYTKLQNGKNSNAKSSALVNSKSFGPSQTELVKEKLLNQQMQI